MAKVIPQKVSEAKVSYVLYPFDRAKTSKEGHHYPLNKGNKGRNPFFFTFLMNKNNHSNLVIRMVIFLVRDYYLFFKI